MREVRQALEPIGPAVRLMSAVQARQTLAAAADLMAEWEDPDIQAFARRLRDHQEALVEPLAWLENQLAPMGSASMPKPIGVGQCPSCPIPA